MIKLRREEKNRTKNFKIEWFLNKHLIFNESDVTNYIDMFGHVTALVQSAATSEQKTLNSASRSEQTHEVKKKKNNNKKHQRYKTNRK